MVAVDGSDKGRISDGDDVDAFSIGDIPGTTNYFSTTGSFSVPAVAGPNEDVFACNALTLCPPFCRFFEVTLMRSPETSAR